jgi:hypothetical protein
MIRDAGSAHDHVRRAFVFFSFNRDWDSCHNTYKSMQARTQPQSSGVSLYLLLSTCSRRFTLPVPFRLFHFSCSILPVPFCLFRSACSTLIVCGDMSAGKSTFSKALMAARPGFWAHINQDTIANGKPGNKRKCLFVAEKALTAGQSCIIDRWADSDNISLFLYRNASYSWLNDSRTVIASFKFIF